MALAPPNVGFGSVYSNGKNIGAWNPYQYINPQETPFEATVKNYMKQLREVQNPWWTTRSESPNKVTANNKTTKVFYKVNHWAWGAKPGTNDAIDNLYIKLFGRRGEPSGLAYWKNLRASGKSLAQIEESMKTFPEWKRVCFGKCKPVMNDVTYLSGQYYEYDKDNFMNSYAISPVPISRSKGSDFPGRWYTFEWEAVEFPYDGEYKFSAQCDNDARFFLDNEAVSEFKIGQGGAAGSVLSTPLQFKETIKGGKHNLRLELYNHPLIEDVAVQGSGAIQQETTTTEETVTTTRQEVQVAGADFLKKSNGYYLAVGGNEETEVVIRLDYNDNIRRAGTAITKLTIPNPNGPDLVLEREKDSNGKYKEKGSVSVKGTFKRDLGQAYGPFILEGNEGSSKLAKVNAAYGPNSDRYGRIEFLDRHGSDVNGSVNIISAKNLQESRTVETTEVVKSTSSEIRTSKKLSEVFNTVDYMRKANRKLWRTNVNNKGGFMNEYGICPFDTLNTLPDNPYAGTHEIVWKTVNFPVSGNYIIEIGVDDNVTLKIGDQVEIRKEGYTSPPAKFKSTGILKEVHYIKQGTYDIVAALEQIPGGKFGFGKVRGKGAIHDYSGKGLNPMALAVNITTVFKKEERTKVTDWNENPMGVAMTIEAPPPPIPQQPKPVQEGRCPANPFWTTRFPGGTTQWHPVFVEGWSKFLNKHAMSPVPPYDTETSSGGGISFENEWTVDIPYDGFYKLKGEADDISTFWVNGTEVLSTSRRENKVRGEKKFFLSKGSATIRVAVENYLFETKQLIDQKIFSTADWAVKKVRTATKETKQVAGADFVKKSDGYYLLVGGNEEVDVSLTLSYDDNIRTAGTAITKITIPNPNGDDLVLEREKDSNGNYKERGSVSVKGTFDRDKGLGYGPLILEGNQGSSKLVNKNTAYGADSTRYGKIDFLDRRGSDTNASISIIAAKNLQASRQSSQLAGGLTGGTIKDGVSYSGPSLASYAKGELGPYLTPAYKDDQDYIDNFNGKTWIMKWENVNFPEPGVYNLKMKADDELKMRVDGKEVGVAKVKQGVKTYNFNISTKGGKTVELELTNLDFNAEFKRNPTVASAIITRKISVAVKKDGKIQTKSWKENPVGVSGILIPPPCPQVVGGKGVVEDVRPICQGNGFKPPTGPGYPVGLKLERIDVDTPGVNYNNDDPVEIDGPAKAHICEMDSYGRVKKVCVTSDVGFTNYPRIRINSPTGSGFRGIPVMSSVRDPIIDPDKLLQVTDLVGVKQTGYYDGRAYYGAIFYKDGVKYAGYYETAGQLVQIYDTMQESIDAQVTTPASAILRQGTDISSDNPRLDIPGTPDNLT